MINLDLRPWSGPIGRVVAGVQPQPHLIPSDPAIIRRGGSAFADVRWLHPYQISPITCERGVLFQKLTLFEALGARRFQTRFGLGDWLATGE